MYEYTKNDQVYEDGMTLHYKGNELKKDDKLHYEFYENGEVKKSGDLTYHENTIKTGTSTGNGFPPGTDVKIKWLNQDEIINLTHK